MIFPSFGFSVSGTRDAALLQIAGVSVDDRPAYSQLVIDKVREILSALPDNASVSVTVNTHLEG